MKEMKKFLSGLFLGAIVFTSIGVFAVSYVAEPATFKIMVNGEEFVADPGAMVINGSTYLPLRAIGKALGVPVEWNAELGQAEVGTAVNNTTSNPVINNTVASNDKWKMKYLNYKEMQKIDDFTQAQDGKEYLLMFFEIENISHQTENFSLFYTDFYIDDIKTSQSIIGYKIDDGMQLTAISVEPGKKAKGYFAFEVSPNWNKWEFTYNEDILKQDTSNTIKFEISK